MYDHLLRDRNAARPVLMQMESEGIMLDSPFLKRFSSEMEVRLREIEDEVYKAADILSISIRLSSFRKCCLRR
jgi:DNA polymerase I-like protein with 3'-5' exonuclease and polymerase domains